MKCSSEQEKHKLPHRFEFIEVLSDFDENFGIGMAYLHEVKGFVSIFQQAAHNGIIRFCIPPTELYKEGEGVPAGSFELDPASLPSNLDDLSDPSDTKIKDGSTLLWDDGIYLGLKGRGVGSGGDGKSKGA
ncbi:unnamed protein product [Dovyalis caffra]|uniref:DUF3444 domain-containing protein n=1 Tax=Dovyalis caffra TaxID=77055 RepID=A0AAV1RIR0_9ROSI|nr:unnamed protein product [Dovyalis caffra]